VAIDRSQPRLALLTSATRKTDLFDPIEAFVRESDVHDRALWLHPSSGDALVALGRAATISSAPSDRWRELLAEADVESAENLLLIGGFAFDPQASPSALWTGAGATRMVLPDRLLRIHANAATWTTNQWAGPRVFETPKSSPTVAARTGLSPAAWRELVADVAGGIRDGSLGARKVVLARTCQIDVKIPIAAVLRTLAAEYPNCTIFAFSVGDGCFLGATPERLVALRQGTATTMALAGSGPRGASAEEDARLADQLLHDPKERTEHAVVVEALREDLAPLSTRVIADAGPRLHTLANLHHLVTPLRARVKPGSCVLDLVERLHPTPAVGGYPRQRALEVIREREELDRGWYAAPLGWVDAKGDGEFVVGLRSALLREGTATLFAGCGIVGDSDPEREFAEAGWKLQPMLSALGTEW
jgi:isochorismate synthase